MNQLQKTNPLSKHNERGFTLVGVLMVLVVLSVLGVSIIAVAASSLKVSTEEHDDQSVFYIAEAGATVEMVDIEKAVADVYGNTDNESSFFSELNSRILTISKSSSAAFEDTLGQETKAKIDVEELNADNPREYKVTSVGFIDSKERIVEQKFSVEWVPKDEEDGIKPPAYPKGMAVFVNDTIKTFGSVKINGSAGTNKSGQGTIDMTWSTNITGEIYVPKGSEKIALIHADPAKRRDSTGLEKTEMIELPNFPSIPTDLAVPDNEKANNEGNIIENGNLIVSSKTTKDYSGKYTLNLSSNLKFKEIKLLNNTTLIIDMKGNDKEIVVDSLDLSSGTIELSRGKGKLKIYIKDRFRMCAGSKFNMDGDLSRLEIYLDESQNKSVDIDWIKCPTGEEKLDVEKSTQCELQMADSNLKFGRNIKLNGSLYAKKSKVVIPGSSQTFGNIFTGGDCVGISGSTWDGTLFLAPSASFEFMGSGKMRGSFFADSLTMSGSVVLEYGENIIKEGLFSATGPSEAGQDGSNENQSGGTSKIYITKSPLLEK